MTTDMYINSLTNAAILFVTICYWGFVICGRIDKLKNEKNK